MINYILSAFFGFTATLLSDEELVAKYLKTQKNQYFSMLYKRYSGKIYAKAYSILKDEFAAQDATQEIMMKILLNLSKFSGKSKFSTWVYSVSYNYCIDKVRDKQKGQSLFVNDLDVNTADVVDEIDDQTILETNVFRLKEVLDQIGIDEKSILLMKYQDDMSIKDICKVLDISESATKMRILRSKQKFVNTYEELFSKNI